MLTGDPPAAHSPAQRIARIVLIAAVGVGMVTISIAVLVWVPLEVTTFQRSTSTACDPCGPPPFYSRIVMGEFDVGVNRYAVLWGVWTTNFSQSPNGVLITINNGPSSGPCLSCTGLLYSSTGSEIWATPAHAWSGFFRVSGTGPFHISVLSIQGYETTTTFQGTIDEAVL